MQKTTINAWSGATSIFVMDRYPWNAAYAYLVRILCVWPAALYRLCTANKTTPRMPKNAPLSILNFKIFLGERAPRPPPPPPTCSLGLLTPMHVTYHFNNLRTGLDNGYSDKENLPTLQKVKGWFYPYVVISVSFLKC